jgi:ribonuclease E
MLINAAHKNEELRIALATGQYLDEVIIQSLTQEEKKSNIYKGIVTRIEPSLEAAFVDYGVGRHGFLPFKEIARSSFKTSFVDAGRRPAINEVIEVGQELIVQVDKEERGNKGAALTTFISLPGCYLVLMPNNPRAGGVSRRIEGDERDEIHSLLSSLTIPEEMGLIIRTAGSGRSQEELQWDLDILLRLWNVIQKASGEFDENGNPDPQNRPAPYLVYQESNTIFRVLRDYLHRDIGEILIDHPDVFREVEERLKLVRPDFLSRVRLYSDPTPLFTRFQIESQIESAFQREIRLPSGGAIIIDYAEALVSVDVNSAKSTKGGDIEETALTTNLEAATEVARQLRLRDIGGLVVIDFIDMTPIRNQREVEERLKKALSIDRARVQVGRISRFGLLEMSRQRLRPSLGESSRVTCPRCLGQGAIRGIESLGLSVIRIIEEEAMKDNTAQVRAILPTEICAYVLNEKRQAIIDIEKRQNVTIIVVPSMHLLTPQYEIERVRLSDVTEKDEKLASYKLVIKPEVSNQPTGTQPAQKVAQEAAVTSFLQAEIPTPPAPTGQRKEKSEPGLLKKLFSFLFDKAEPQSTVQEKTHKPRHHQRSYGDNRSDAQNRGGRHHANRGNRSPRHRRPGSTGQPYRDRGYENRDNREHKETKESRDNPTRENRDGRDNREHRHASRGPRERYHNRQTQDVASTSPHVATETQSSVPMALSESAPAVVVKEAFVSVQTTAIVERQSTPDVAPTTLPPQTVIETSPAGESRITHAGEQPEQAGERPAQHRTNRRPKSRYHSHRRRKAKHAAQKATFGESGHPPVGEDQYKNKDDDE